MKYQHVVTGEVREISADQLAAWQAAGNPKAAAWLPWVPPAQPQAPAVYSVSPAQMRAALRLKGKDLATIEAAIAAIPDAQLRIIAEERWGYATEFRRTDPIVQAIAPLVGFDAAALDELFAYAATL